MKWKRSLSSGLNRFHRFDLVFSLFALSRGCASWMEHFSRRSGCEAEKLIDPVASIRATRWTLARPIRQGHMSPNFPLFQSSSPGFRRNVNDFSISRCGVFTILVSIFIVSGFLELCAKREVQSYSAARWDADSSSSVTCQYSGVWIRWCDECGTIVSIMVRQINRVTRMIYSVA